LHLFGIPGHCRQLEQGPWTGRIPGVCSGWGKGGIPPAIVEEQRVSE
jgi:hypothetical protein